MLAVAVAEAAAAGLSSYTESHLAGSVLRPCANESRGPCPTRRPSRGLVKPDVIILVPGKTSIQVIRGGRGQPMCVSMYVARQRDACGGLLQRKQVQTQRVN